MSIKIKLKNNTQIEQLSNINIKQDQLQTPEQRQIETQEQRQIETQEQRQIEPQEQRQMETQEQRQIETKKIKIKPKLNTNFEIQSEKGIINKDTQDTQDTKDTKDTRNTKDRDTRIDNIYEKLEHRASILKNYDFHIGSISSERVKLFILNEDSTKIQKEDILYIHGVHKLYDESLMNARDQKVRLIELIANQKLISEGKLQRNDKIYMDHVYKVTKNIWINITSDTISIKNDGDGIDVAMHKEGMYVPQLIFGTLLTSRNYDDNEKRTTGGKNGLGAKLCNIFSTEFTVETIDSYRKKKYVQTYYNNMEKACEPVITNCNTAPYTLVKFKPDFKIFGTETFQNKRLINNLFDGDIVRLMKKRAYDIAGTCQDLTIYFNDEKIHFRSFERYVDMYIGSRGDYKRLYANVNKDWEIATCASSDGTFEHVSFVNGICTYKGGKHVDHVSDMLSKNLQAYAVEKKKGMKNITTNSIKNNMMIFVNCIIENPTFTSQSKDELTTQTAKYRSKCVFEKQDDFNTYIEKLSDSKINILESALNTVKAKETSTLIKETNGKARRVIDKLDDATACKSSNPKERLKCKLILAEGDSAKSAVISALKAFHVDERQYYGVMALKGKIKNINGATDHDILDSEQIKNIIFAVGIEKGIDYTINQNYEKLKYGEIWLMTDADVDGDHIKGLVMNFINEYNPSLLKRQFIMSPLTPILKITIGGSKTHTALNKGKDSIDFYCEENYSEWLELNKNKMKINSINKNRC